MGGLIKDHKFHDFLWHPPVHKIKSKKLPKQISNCTQMAKMRNVFKFSITLALTISTQADSWLEHIAMWSWENLCSEDAVHMMVINVPLERSKTSFTWRFLSRKRFLSRHLYSAARNLNIIIISIIVSILIISISIISTSLKSWMQILKYDD